MFSGSGKKQKNLQEIVFTIGEMKKGLFKKKKFKLYSKLFSRWMLAIWIIPNIYSGDETIKRKYM